MVLVCLGTQDMPFTRLLKMVEECIDQKIINEEVIAQVGSTNYQSDKIKCFEYCNADEMQALISKANYIITHGGTGTIVSSLKLNKKVIAVNRLAKYKEHTDDHQIQIIKEFFDTGYIKACFEEDKLSDVVKSLDEFETVPFISNTHNILDFLYTYIEQNK